MCRLSRNLGALTSRTPQGHVGLFRGYFTFYLDTLNIGKRTASVTRNLFEIILKNNLNPCSRVFLQMLTGPQLIKKFHIFFNPKLHYSSQCPAICPKPETQLAHALQFYFVLPWRNSRSRPRLPHYRGFIIILRHSTLGRTPLDEWPALRRDLYLTKHNTFKRHPCLRWVSNPQSQQASGSRPTP
jgi:hypothetical protein